MRSASAPRRLRQWALAWAMGTAATLSWAGDCDPGLPRWEPLLPEVWAWPGLAAEPSPDNQGQVTTPVVWLDGTEATLLDPGPSHRHAQALVQAVQCQLGARVTQVLNSHAHAEHVLGNSAFAPEQIWATAATRQAMAQRCAQCLAHWQHLLGAQALEQTHTVLPQQVLSPGLRWLGGQFWEVSEWKNAHSESDLVLWQPETRVLLAGALVYRQRLPELAQGSALGWLAALKALQALEPRQVIGLGRGDVTDLQNTQAYLCALIDQVWQAMERGQLASQSLLPLPQYADWAGYAQRHGFNVQRVWRELEPWWIEQRPLPNYCQTSGGNWDFLR